MIRSGRLAWAGYVTVDADQVLPVPAPASCSAEDLAEVRIVGGRVAPGGPVRCATWVAAREAGPERIEVATCRGARCGPLLPWSRAWGESFTLPVHPPWPARSSPLAITWTVATAVVVGAASAALYAAGAFEPRGPDRVSYTFSAPARR